MNVRSAKKTTWGRGVDKKIAILDEHLTIGSMTAWVRSTIDGRQCISVDCIDRHTSVNLIYHMDEYAEEKRT